MDRDVVKTYEVFDTHREDDYDISSFLNMGARNRGFKIEQVVGTKLIVSYYNEDSVDID